LFIDIDLTKTPQRPKLYLCKPNKTIIASLKEHYGASLKLNLTTLNELTFELPYQLDINHELQHNNHCDKIKNRYLIKLILGDYTEFFIISDPSPNADDNSDFLQVNCYSLEYELKDKNIRSYKVDAVKLSEVMNGFSRDVTTVTNGISTTVTTNTDGILKETAWTLGEFPIELDLVYRSFEVSVKTKLDFILEVAEKFNLVAKFDSNLRKVNFYTLDTSGTNKGLRISDTRYLRTIVQNIDSETFCTRLKLYGKDGMTINEINPTGQSYIENYSAFLFPFQRNEDTKEVIAHSDYMSDSLCNAILDYQILLTQHKADFPTLLATLTTKQTEMTALTNAMTILIDEMKVIDDNLVTASGSKKTTYTDQKIAKQVEIDALQLLINAKQAEIDVINASIKQIATDMSYETYFTPELLSELIPYIIEKDWTNESLISAEDLYIYGLDEMESRKNIVTIIQISIVNFLEIISEQSNWDKINLGDSISIVHKQLGIDLTARIIEGTYDFENYEIQLTISNVKSKNSKLSDLIYTTTSVVDVINVNKLKWDKSQDDAKEYVDLQIQEMTGSLLNLSIDIERFGADGFITKDEANTLKLTLEQAIAESEDILNIAEELEIITEANNYNNALDALETELRNDWIDQPNYPIQIISDSSPEDERIIISNLFKTVEDTKSILINTIGKVRQDDGKRYVETQITELNTVLSAFQTQVNEYIESKEITQTESVTLSGLFVDVQTESDDITAIADELMEIIGEDNVLYDSLHDARNSYYNVDRNSGAIHDVFNEIDDWFNKSSYPITISRTKGINVNKKISKVETTKETLTALIAQVQIDNELTLVDQQLFEVSVAITSMQMDIKAFANGNYITYDESVSLKASFDTILAESTDIINIAESMSVSTTLINNYQNSLTGTVVSCGVDGLQVELNKWVDLPIESYAGKGLKITSKQKTALLNKFNLVMSTKLSLNNAITLATPEYSIDGEISIRGVGANQSGNRFLKINGKSIADSSLSNSENKGLMLTVINREDLAVIPEHTQCYHTFDVDADRTALATKLNSLYDTLFDTVIIVLTSYDSIGWNQTLLDAMIKIGGTGTDTGVGKFPFALIGIPGLFKGSALEVFSDSGTKAPYADISTIITDGTPQGIAIGTSVISAQAILAVQKAESGKIVAMVDINKVATTTPTSITSTEKKLVKKYWDAIVNEKSTVESQASYYNSVNYPDVVSTLASYEIAYYNLSSYISTILSSMTTPSTIVSATFISTFESYYNAKITLLKAIMGVARNYIGDAIEGLAGSMIGLALEINDAFNDSKIFEPEATRLASDLASVVAESTPLIELATSLGLDRTGEFEKTNYETALNDLSTTLSEWIGKDSSLYPFTVTADDKNLVKKNFEDVNSTKSLLQNKLATVQINNAKMSTSASLKTFVNTLYSADITNFQSQSDYKIECWFYGYSPSLNNLPSIEWETNTIKDEHVGDLFYDVATGNSYRFSSAYQWVSIADTSVLQVLSDASKSLGSIDSKRTIFVATPPPPYNMEDLWREGITGNLKICIIERLTGNYVSSDWIDSTEYTDDIAISIAKSLANQAKTNADNAMEDLDEIADGGKITKTEKVKILKPIWDAIVTEEPNYHNQSLLYSSVEMTALDLAYTTAFDALDTYLNVTILPNNVRNPTPILGDLTKTTNVIREEFDSKFNDYYNARSDLYLFITSSAKNYVSANLEDFKTEVYEIDKEIFQNQIDGKIETWFSGYLPTLNNSPANKWTKNSLKDGHVGDLFYNTTSGLAYKFTLSGSTYSWIQETDPSLVSALHDASIAMDTADGTRRVFTQVPPLYPIPPYDISDLWSQGYAGDMMICITKKSLGGSYSSADWIKSSKYTDDTIASAAYSLASQAQSTALVAEAEIVDVADDSMLTVKEKTRTVKPQWDLIVGERFNYDAQAASYSIGFERDNYNAAYYALSDYITPLVTTYLNVKSPIVKDTFVLKFHNYYTYRTALLYKISTIIKDTTVNTTDYVRTAGYAVSTGTANAYVATLTPAPTSLVDGLGINLKIHVSNTGTSTLNVNNLGVKQIKSLSGANLTSGMLTANTIYPLRYESSSGTFVALTISNSFARFS